MKLENTNIQGPGWVAQLVEASPGDKSPAPNFPNHL